MLIAEGRRLTSARYDCFIVGSGPVGLTMALDLAGAGRRVLVIESAHGGAECAPSVGYGHYGAGYWSAHSLRGFGGTSAVWSDWCTTLQPLDFDNPAVGRAWPISREDLVPWYVESGTYINRDASVVEFERPWFGPLVYRPLSTRPATRFGERYFDTVARSQTVDVALGYTAVGVEANESRSAVTHLDYYSHDGGLHRRLLIRPHQALVLASGGLGNAHLLLQPRSDGRIPVGNERGQVGRHLMEHPHFFAAGVCLLDENFSSFRPGPSFGGLVHNLVLDRTTMETRGLYGCGIELGAGEGDDEIRSYLERRTGRRHAPYSINLRSEMLPTADNRIVVTAERDRAGLHRAAARCVLGAADFTNAETTLRVLAEALVAGDRGRLRIDNDRIYHRVLGGGHILGTTRMGTRRSDSVVDSYGRVHGYRNFFVAGCSVFPTGGYANPTWTAMALALRTARTIRTLEE